MKKKVFYGWWIVLGAVFIFATITPAAVALASKFLIPVTSDLGFSRSQFTLSNAILQAMGIFFSPMIANLYGKNNFKFLHAVSVVVFGLGLSTYGLAQNILHFYLISIVLGVSLLGASFIPITTMIANWFIEKRSIATSLAMTGIGVGGFILSPLITLWIDQFGWRMTYMIYGVIIIAVSLPISLVIFKEKPEDMGMQPLGYKDIKKDTDNHASGQPAASRNFNFTLTEAKGRPFFILLMVGMVIIGLINSSQLGQFPPSLEELHSPTVAAGIISLYSIVGIFGKIILGWVNDKFGIQASTIYACGLVILTSTLVLFSANLTLAYILAISFGMGNAIGTVTPALLTTAFFDASSYGRAYGFMQSALQLGMTGGSLLVAAIFDFTGSYTLAWLLILFLSFMTLISWLAAFINVRKYV